MSDLTIDIWQHDDGGHRLLSAPVLESNKLGQILEISCFVLNRPLYLQVP